MTEHKITWDNNPEATRTKIIINDNKVFDSNQTGCPCGFDNCNCPKGVNPMTNTNQTEVLPCPFCGSQAYTYPNGFAGHVVKCKSITCGAHIVYLNKGDGSNWAIEKWNTRPLPPVGDEIDWDDPVLVKLFKDAYIEQVKRVEKGDTCTWVRHLYSLSPESLKNEIIKAGYRRIRQ